MTSREGFPRGWDWRLVQEGIEGSGGGRALKGQGARSHLVKHHAERKKMAANVDVLAERLLGRHISHRAHRHSRAGELPRLRG